MARATKDGMTGSTKGSSTGMERDAIAICGLACRLPGDSNSPQAFWELLAEGRSGICDVPKSRFNINGFYHPSGTDRPGSVPMKRGYFIQDDITAFDNSLFGINNLEAASMDPQQRKLLEVVFECLENAGVPLEKASGSNTGCYVGNFTFDFISMQARDADYMSRYSATGFGTTILANRVSHVFNLQGPSFVLDTACSSSMYCLHAACTSLESFESDAAIVASANLIQSPEQHIATAKAGILSPTSECHTFDTSADGYGRADGIGALYLKRLADAVKDGDAIRGVIRGSAINANGRTAGITLPSSGAQERVIRKALEKGDIHPNEITYVECHGTGTKVGDAIEVDALSSVFQRASHHPLYIGSVKSNIGHSEAASAISSVIKGVMAMERGQIPGTHGLRHINPTLRAEERHISIPKTLIPWPQSHNEVRRMGINSFGYGGANAHAIIEEAPSMISMSRMHGVHPRSTTSQPAIVFVLSAATAKSLESRIQDFMQFDLEQADSLDLAYTLGSRRTHFPMRGFIIASCNETTNVFNNNDFSIAHNPAQSQPAPPAFVFTGQGSVWAGMCQELFEFPVFRDVIDEMDSVLKKIPNAPTWSLGDAIFNCTDPGLIHLPQRSQTCCTAIQVALVRLLRSWDILPSVVVGHSSGEIAAAFAAGHISTAEAIAISYYRGYCVSKNSAYNGAMMAVGLSESTAAAQISEQGLDGQVKVACINSPESVTVSGDTIAVEKLQVILQEAGVFARRLNTGGQAYHSHHMLKVADEYQSLLDSVLPTLRPSSLSSNAVDFVSSVTGGIKKSGFSGPYWRMNLEGQVRFSQAIEQINNTAEHYFVELGPHSSLELPIKQTVGTAKISRQGPNLNYMSAVKRNGNALYSTLSLAGELWIHGHRINWAKVNGLLTGNEYSTAPYRVVKDLPPYRFTYENVLWNECRGSVEYRHRKYPHHELLGTIIPGGNGRDLIFRNLLRLDDVPWLRDHRLGDTPLLPGAAYLAMAMEAVMQATGSHRISPSFRLANISIMNPLALSNDHPSQVEVFTSLHRSVITNSTSSSMWWDFAVSSYREGTAIQHASGSVSIEANFISMKCKYQAPVDYLEPTTKRTWYERFIGQGLNYGPAFQPVNEFQTPRMQSGLFCGATVPYLKEFHDPMAIYPIHPITLDSLIQTSIVATARGVPKDLTAQVPSRIGSLTLNTALLASGESVQISSQAQKTGFMSWEAGAEIVNQLGDVVLQVDQLRLFRYLATAQGDADDQRHPVLRVLWKPDIYGLGLMASEDAAAYAHKFAVEANSPVADDGLLKMGAMIDLVVHKNAGLRILELCNAEHGLTIAILELLQSRSDYQRLKSYSTASITENGTFIGGPVSLDTAERYKQPMSLDHEKFDLIIIPSMAPWPEDQIQKLIAMLNEDGTVIGLRTSSSGDSIAFGELARMSFPVSEGQANLVVARRPATPHRDTSKVSRYLIVERQISQLGSALQDLLKIMHGTHITRVVLADLMPEHIPPHTAVFNLCELESPLVSEISDEDMHRIKLMTDQASSLVWVTTGDKMAGTIPDFSVVNGIARALALEQPSLRFYTYDLGTISEDLHYTAQRLVSVLQQAGVRPDFEFVQRKGVVHVSRFVPDDKLNAAFRMKQGLELQTMRLSNAGDLRLAIKEAGQFDTIFFQQQEASHSISPLDVRIKVAAVGMNAKDFYVLAGRVDTLNATCQLECAGTVEAVGSEVVGLAVGDRVVAMAPTHIQTFQILPHWACYKLEEAESLEACVTLPLVTSTAIYALHHRAQIQAGESVLIHSGAGGVGMAAIQLAKSVGAEIYTTVSTEEKKQYLIDRFGVKPSNVFSSKDTSFLDGVLKATGGVGVDIILNSLTGDQLRASWQCIAPFGRFVEIGKTDLTAHGRLEMDKFLRNATFTAFDLSSLYDSNKESHHALWKDLLSQTMSLYRLGKISEPRPLKVFDIAEIVPALRHFSSRNRMGKVVLSLQDGNSELTVQPLRYASTLSSHKTYIMVGCLGGLGRTLARWMVQRGARKFAFLGRSGLEKPAAQNMIRDLEGAGAACVVVKGDVCSIRDVEVLVKSTDGDIGGVVQAAMGLSESLFSTMSSESWHTGIDPKVKGTWNLHNMVRASGRGNNLDFFLLTSSVSGSVGTATESNYCAGNHFLDIFARHLRSRGVPAVSVGLGMISEVGYLHENPEIEAILLRKGIQAIDPDELLQIVDLALSYRTGVGIHHAYDNLSAAHLLTGLEASGLKRLRKMGFDGTNPTWNDPRAGILANALGDGGGSPPPAHNGNLPLEVSQAIEEEDKTLGEAVLDFIRKRFGNLVLMKYEAVDVKKPLADYGMDSMIAAEFRTWFYQAMTVDISMLTLLGKTSSLEDLRDMSVAQLEERGD